MTSNTSRRHFLKGSAAVALIVGFGAGGLLEARANSAAEKSFNPFIKIRSDNKIIAVVKHFEMGQGTSTGLTTILAEELDADWDDMIVEFAPADRKNYANLFWGGSQGTGGSSSIANSFTQYRKAGAAARDMLIRAAAGEWHVPASEIKTSKGVLSHASGKTARYGDMAAAAAKLNPAEDVALKKPQDFTLIGNATLPRKDSASKTDGSAIFAMDVKLPDMLYVVVARPPRFGGKVKSYTDKATRAVRGVVDVRQIPRGIAVYAKNTWAAIKGREALEVDWDFMEAENKSTAEMEAHYTDLLTKPGNIAKEEGDVDKAWDSAAKKISLNFNFPFLAHAPMEPQNCVIRYEPGKGAEIWDGCQSPSMTQDVVSKILGLEVDAVKVNTTYAGGSFGRRANFTADYGGEAAMAALAIEGRHPVKLIWTREDDLKGGYYRPMHLERVEVALDDNNAPSLWRHRITGIPFFPLPADKLDRSAVEGVSNLPYAIPNIKVDQHNVKSPISTLWWRSVGHTHTAFSKEVTIDILAEMAGADPVAFRLNLLKDHPRQAGVLKLVAEKAGWDTPLPDGWGRGVAVHESFNSFVAQVVEVSRNKAGAIKVERVVCAVDCGIAVNPDVITAQMEGGIGYGLGTVMRNRITFDQGEVVQDNFPDYEPLRMSDMPKVEVHIMPSMEKPTGVGEPGLPPCAPALGNAIFQVTGERITVLPFGENGIKFA
ncbi:MAG: xanthine dehydrogenase family protein molybdopterin-binding subunit [Alphaproteobacteria bacterium]|nr:xanthine dehydrogenase family protein molybdopterin-binding subunit [Alphaproteobacteria bacterium]